MGEPLDRFFGESRVLVNLLQFSIFSARPEPLFVYLVREYRNRPTAAGALGLFDQFCAPQAPFRLRAVELLPPRELTLAAAVATIRAAVERSRVPPPPPVAGEDPPRPVRVPIPPAALFLRIEEALLTDPDGELARVAATFRPDQGPFENLPGGKLTPGQRAFVDGVWLKRVRPALLAAGFGRVGSLGQP